MDDELIIQRLAELKTQIADFDERLSGLDDPLADGLTDEACAATPGSYPRSSRRASLYSTISGNG